jgi:hypothetical protein
MKTLISLITIFTFLTVKSYCQNSNVNALLEKPETRKEIINSILNNHNYMTEFIQEMHGNQHAMMMLNGNNQMTGNQGDMGMNGSNQMMGNNNQMGMNGENHMMDRSYMINMMNNNPGMMQTVMQNMMDVVSGDCTMTHSMVNIMYNHPQMRQMFMQQLNHPGMSGSNGKMNMMNPNH